MRTSQSRTVPTLVAALVSTAAALKLATSTPQSITGVTPADVTIPSDDLGGAAAAGHWPLAGSDAREALEKCYSSPSACKEPAANNIDKVAPKSVKAKAAKETKTADGKISIGDEAEAAAIKSLAKLLPSILKRAGCAPKTSIWGVELAADKLGQRSSILAAFLRAVSAKQSHYPHSRCSPAPPTHPARTQRTCHTSLTPSYPASTHARSASGEWTKPKPFSSRR